MFEFEFKPGDEAEHISGQQVVIVERTTSECHGGIQGFYLCRVLTDDRGFHYVPQNQLGCHTFAAFEIRKRGAKEVEAISGLRSLESRLLQSRNYDEAAIVRNAIEEIRDIRKKPEEKTGE